jgi:hypothetical protein
VISKREFSLLKVIKHLVIHGYSHKCICYKCEAIRHYRVEQDLVAELGLCYAKGILEENLRLFRE